MKKFKKKSDAHNFICEVIWNKIEDGILSDSLMISYGRFAEWLVREYPGKTEWDQSSLSTAIEEWNFGSWWEYAEYTGCPERTCQRYAVKGEDYKLFCGKFVSCQASADQFKRELDYGKRGNRPKFWTDPS